ncbi:hypothetical protein [Halogranum rubrum]|uniref:hypothetical protein n=1 Tax=Halogranum rubrum TaxID=553466 RepID=UPI0012FA992A|nr:hypothetical protein [Halogranum salarium]
MTESTSIDDLRERLVGARFYNAAIDESFTVVAVTNDGLMAFLQYDDGVGWDELAAPDLLSKEEAEFFGVSVGGIDDTQYEPLGSGPTLKKACLEGEHDWYPRPSQLGWDDVEKWHTTIDGSLVANTYLRLARCKRCGLSGDVLSQFANHETPSICDRCGTEIIPGEDERVWEPTPEWRDSSLCSSCAVEESERYEPVEVTCYSCELNLGLEGENTPIFGSSMIGQQAGADEDESIFLCESCQQRISEELSG